MLALISHAEADGGGRSLGLGQRLGGHLAGLVVHGTRLSRCRNLGVFFERLRVLGTEVEDAATTLRFAFLDGTARGRRRRRRLSHVEQLIQGIAQILVR